jgi:hypothetical protein
MVLNWLTLIDAINRLMNDPTNELEQVLPSDRLQSCYYRDIST